MEGLCDAWNAALESGDAERIKVAKANLLMHIARATMDDEPNYALAGWKAGK